MRISHDDILFARDFVMGQVSFPYSRVGLITIL